MWVFLIGLKMVKERLRLNEGKGRGGNKRDLKFI